MSEVNQSGFDIAMKANERAFFQKPEVLGLDNLEKIPLDRPLIIAVTHFSDADPQTVAAELGPEIRKRRPGHIIGLAWEYPPTSPIVEPVTKLAGARKYLYDIDTSFDPIKDHLTFRFNPENFKKMAEAMRNNTDMIIAAHQPLSNIKGKNFRWELPRLSGLGAVYLAQRAGGVILPVAVDIQSDEPVGISVRPKDIANALLKLKERSKVRVIAGEPLQLDHLDSEILDDFDKYVNRVKPLNPGVIEKGRNAHSRLKAQGDLVMRSLAVMLPQSKRGKW